jgi:hypothetical protein
MDCCQWPAFRLDHGPWPLKQSIPAWVRVAGLGPVILPRLPSSENKNKTILRHHTRKPGSGSTRVHRRAAFWCTHARTRTRNRTGMAPPRTLSLSFSCAAALPQPASGVARNLGFLAADASLAEAAAFTPTQDPHRRYTCDLCIVHSRNRSRATTGSGIF